MFCTAFELLQASSCAQSTQSKSRVCNRHISGTRLASALSQQCHPRRRACKQFCAAEDTLQFETKYDAWYTPNFNPKKFVGPIAVRSLEGKGRGILASRPIQAGELLLASEPVLALFGTGQDMPQPDALSKSIAQGVLPEHRARWLTRLYNGTDESTRQLPTLETSEKGPNLDSSDSPWQAGAVALFPSAPDNLSSVTDQIQTQTPAATGNRKRKSSTTPTKGFGASGATTKRSTKTSGSSSTNDAARRQSINQIVSLNCFGERRGDLAAAMERNEEPAGFIGLWPEFSLLNHSCAPNTSNWVLGDKMLVRAVRPIAKGEEVTVSYLGRAQLAPLDVRREQLRDSYGFTCECRRCQVELDTYDTFGSIVDAAHAECEGGLQSLVASAREAGDQEALLDARDLLQSHTLQLNAAFRSGFVAPAARLYGQASMYLCLELLRDCQRALSEDTSHTSLTCVRALEAASPGSDIHAVVAAQHAQQVVLECSEGSPQAQAAWQLCRSAHTMRYGPISDALLRRLAHSNATMYD